MEIVMHQTNCGQYVLMSHHPHHPHHAHHDHDLLYSNHGHHELKRIATSRLSERTSLVPSSPPSPLGVIDLTNEDDDDDEDDESEEESEEESESEEEEASMRMMPLDTERMIQKKRRVSFCPVVQRSAAIERSSVSSWIMTEEERSDVWYRQAELDGFKSLARTLSRRIRDRKKKSQSSLSSVSPTTALCWSNDHEQLAESLLQHPTIMTADDDDDSFHPPQSPPPSPPQEDVEDIEEDDVCTWGLEQRISVERQRNKYMCLKWILQFQRHLKKEEQIQQQPNHEQQAAEQLAQFAIGRTAWATKIAIDTGHLDFLDAYPPPPNNEEPNTIHSQQHQCDPLFSRNWDDCPRMPAIKRKGQRTTLDHVWDDEDNGDEPIDHHAIRNVRRRTYPIPTLETTLRNENDVILCAFPQIMRLT